MKRPASLTCSNSKTSLVDQLQQQSSASIVALVKQGLVPKCKLTFVTSYRLSSSCPLWSPNQCKLSKRAHCSHMLSAKPYSIATPWDSFHSCGLNGLQRLQFHIKSISWDRGKVDQYLTSINQLVQASLFIRVQHNFKRPKVTTLCNKFLFSYIDQRLCHFQPLRERHDAFRSYRPFPRHSEHVGDSKQCGWWAADHVWRFNARPQAAHWYQVLQRYSQTVQTWSALQGDGERRISLLLESR